jgi:hypothetical protein
MSHNELLSSKGNEMSKEQMNHLRSRLKEEPDTNKIPKTKKQLDKISKVNKRERDTNANLSSIAYRLFRKQLHELSPRQQEIVTDKMFGSVDLKGRNPRQVK